MIFKFNLLIALLFVTSCASRPVIEVDPSRQNSLQQTKSKSKVTEKKPEPKSPIIIEPIKPVAPAAPPIAEIKINPKVQTPDSLLKNANNSAAANDLIENTLTLNELEAAAADSSLSAFKPQLLLKIGKVYQKNKNPERAGEYYRSVTALYPQSTQATQASVLLASLHASTSEADANVIGAILPLTGRNASVGQHALNAIRLALELNKPENKFRIALFDSKSEPDMAAKGVDKLVNEDKAIVILGGFSAKEAVAIANRTELMSIPFIAFSQKPGLTNIGDYVFRNALTPEMQVDRLVSFAWEKLSARKFAVLYPNDSYGVEFANSFWDHVLARGGQITAAQVYDPKATDFSDVIQKMVGTYYEDARASEFKQRLEEMKASARKKSKEKSAKIKSQRDSYADSNILPPIVDFDVLFVPDNSRALGQVLAFMKFNDVTKMNYLGTNLWNSADLPKRAANDDDAGIFYVDAIDTNDTELRASSFFKEYTQTYNEEPTLVEVQAYEATKLVKDQIQAGISGREALAIRLRDIGSITGLTGTLKMNDLRELVRPVHVMGLDSGVIKKVE